MYKCPRGNQIHRGNSIHHIACVTARQIKLLEEPKNKSRGRIKETTPPKTKKKKKITVQSYKTEARNSFSLLTHPRYTFNDERVELLRAKHSKDPTPSILLCFVHWGGGSRLTYSWDQLKFSTFADAAPRSQWRDTCAHSGRL